MQLADKEKCTGCLACVNKCVNNALGYKENDEGFWFPVIDYDKCINCGVCVKVCPEMNDINEYMCKDKHAYAAVNLDSNILNKGSSGSVFYELAKKVIEDNGIVYGCAWKDKYSIEHIRVSNVKQIDKLLKSKYIQSNIGLVYRNVLVDLKNTKKVLFCGTPCQVAGLKCYIGKDYDNLICVDVVCHGVPNQKIFSEFISLLEKKEKGEVTSYCFRDKVDGLGSYLTSYKVKNKKKLKQWTGLSYSYLFMNNYLLRPSCYNCNYANIERVGDITLGDFWGIEKIDNSFDIDKGVSAIIINSEKGNRVFKEIINKFIVKEVSYRDVVENNAQMKNRPIKPKDRDYIWGKYIKNGYLEFERYYKRNTRIVRLRSNMKLFICNITHRNGGKGKHEYNQKKCD